MKPTLKPITILTGALMAVLGPGCERKVGADTYAAQEASKEATRVADARVANAEKSVEKSGRDAEMKAIWDAHKASNWKAEHRTWVVRGGYSGYRIPEDRYKVNFGSDHAFRFQGNPVTVAGGNPRFQYGGYWLNVVDPWPEYWAEDWFDKDDVYVEYAGDGYYLLNRRYAGDRIAINVTQN